MNVRLTVGMWLSMGCLAGSIQAAAVESSLIRQGGEYPLTPLLRGDQVHPRAALGQDGGYLVWQDNAADGDGSAISAVRLGPELAPFQSPFLVNRETAGDQARPDVALLEGGGAVFVWQHGDTIRTRTVDAQGVFLQEEDTLINTHRGTPKVNPVVASLPDGGYLVVWASFGQDDKDSQLAQGTYRPLQGVYAQRMGPNGERIGSEFRVHEQVEFNQRNPVVARLSTGNIAIVWVNEKVVIDFVEGQLSDQIVSIEIRGRLLDGLGQFVGEEFLVSGENAIAANPSISAGPSGFIVAWCQLDKESRNIGYEIFARTYSDSALPKGSATLVNSHQYGDQFSPIVAANDSGELVVWSSLQQDGSREGVFGQFFEQGLRRGGEFQVNTTFESRQMHPQVVDAGNHGFLALWTGYVGSPRDFEIFGQRFGMSLPPAPTPIVSAISSSSLSVSWSPIGGYDDVEYLVYVDGAEDPKLTKDILWSSGAVFQPATDHTVRLAYRLPGGMISPLSATAQGRTWGPDENFDGLPDDWQQAHWGSDQSTWPGPLEDSDGDGMSNRNEFLAGTDPRQSSSVLKTKVNLTEQGLMLSWNVQPGLVYKVQDSSDLQQWTDVGGPRFARSTEDELLLPGVGSGRYYRVIRMR